MVRWLSILACVILLGCDPCKDGTCPAQEFVEPRPLPSTILDRDRTVDLAGEIQQAVEQLGVMRTEQVELTGGVVAPGGGFGNRVDYVINGQTQSYRPDAQLDPRRYDVEAQRWLDALPPDDRESIYITLFLQSGGQVSQKLWEDIQNHSTLNKIFSWANVNQYDTRTKTGAEHAKAFRVGYTPVIVVHTGANAQTLPAYRLIALEANYDGDPEALSERLVASLSRFLQRWDGRIRPYRPRTPVTPDDTRRPDNFDDQADAAARPQDWAFPRRQPARQPTAATGSMSLVWAFVITVRALTTWRKYRNRMKG